LHDAGDYDGAIAIYKKLLEAHPDNPTILYEMAFSSLEKGDYEATVRFAQLALENHSKSPAGCYVLIGSAYDGMGRLKEGEKSLKEGLRSFPRDQMLHFNLGVNLWQQGKMEDAEKEFQESLMIRPDHPGSWLSLAKGVEKLGWPGRAILCYERFLTLEPSSKRSPGPAEKLQALLDANVEETSAQDAPKSEITVTIPEVSSGKKKDERTQETFMLSLAAALRYTDEGKKLGKAGSFASAMSSVTAMMLESEAGKKAGDFWNDLVFAYYQDAQKEGHLEAMAYATRRSLNDPEITQWLEAHVEQVERYQAWTSSWEPAPRGKR
ncbi:MAG: tetratricopeptide repeat protein, partial [Acidobacteria bacterium]|nr:tetratricopeptide repeat protein [Acidobacteriota bacterium]